MKIAINWSYIEAGTIIVKVPNKTDLQKVCDNLILKANNILSGNEDVQVDEIYKISDLQPHYNRHPEGKLVAIDPLGIGEILGIEMQAHFTISQGEFVHPGASCGLRNG